MPSFTDEQSRALANLAQHYDAWVGYARRMRGLAYGMGWKTIAGKEYLYEIRDRAGNATSLGPRSPENEVRFNAYHETKDDLKERTRSSRARIEETSAICRALRVPLLNKHAAEALAQFDVNEALGPAILVAGTNAMPAYSIEANRRLVEGGDLATDDCDLVWAADSTTLLVLEHGKSILQTLKEVDETYTVNEERPFQIRNRAAYEVEILVPPSRRGTLPARDRLKPVPMPEVEWLLPGERVEQVVPARGGGAARVVAPDPRWFAVQKLWLSAQAKRSRLKASKDHRQAEALLDACVEGYLPRHRLTREFVAELPDELRPIWNRWADERGFSPAA
jgi:hypothetical protein